MATKGTAEVVEHCRRGWQLLGNGNFEGAAKEFQKAVEIQEDSLDAHEGLGLSFCYLIEGYDKILDDVIRPGSVPLEVLLLGGQDAKPGTISIAGVPFDGSKFLELVDLVVRASQELRRAFELGTRRIEVFEALARMPDVESTVKKQCLDKALGLNPRSAWANYLRGMEYVAWQDYENAAEHLELAIESNPDLGEWRSELGNVLIKLGRYNEAIEQLLVAVRLKPSYASSWYNLGTAYFKAGNRKLAMSAYRRFLEIEPFSPDAQRLKGWFPELTGASG